MPLKNPLRQVIDRTRPQWDCDSSRPVVRADFNKILACGTPAMGGDVYCSPSETRRVYFTCKSRMCPKCARRQTVQWQMEQRASLPDMEYAGIVFTMPDHLWPIFKQNRNLLNNLEALAGDVIQRWVKSRHGASAMVMVVRHTFGRALNFNSHVHTLVSANGWSEAAAQWVPIRFNKNALMLAWREAVITYLRAALAAGILQSGLEDGDARGVLDAQAARWWNIDIDESLTKEHFIAYACRYVKHPPIANHRFFAINSREVKFWRKDHKLKRTVPTTYDIGHFIETFADHVPDRYKHSIRYFGLLSPRSKHRLSAILYAALGQEKPPRPARLTWSELSLLSFGKDPLVDGLGQRMRWAWRRAPQPALRQ